jgi:Na+/glutamate symporter
VVLRISLARIEVLIWVLIYGGLLVLAVGLALREVHGLLAGTVSLVGGLIAAVGVALIWIRSRMVKPRPPSAADASKPPR